MIFRLSNRQPENRTFYFSGYVCQIGRSLEIYQARFGNRAWSHNQITGNFTEETIFRLLFSR